MRLVVDEPEASIQVAGTALQPAAFNSIALDRSGGEPTTFGFLNTG
ncbi:hypothetical protein [Burkholderia sp. MSMB1589WGS]|nr:hypothetical protein [Burkholderia sp. MSMB1589WGS]